MGFVVDKVALEQVFFKVPRFPLSILIPPTAPHSSSSIIRGWYNKPISGRCTKWAQSHPTPRELKNQKSGQSLSLHCADILMLVPYFTMEGLTDRPIIIWVGGETYVAFAIHGKRKTTGHDRPKITES
jgi:hypothetical protein